MKLAINRKHFELIGVVALALLVLSTVAMASANSARQQSFADTVRQATAQFRDVAKAEKAGYALLHGCVSGPQEGAMGIHYANGNLVGDGALDAQHPEA